MLFRDLSKLREHLVLLQKVKFIRKTRYLFFRISTRVQKDDLMTGMVDADGGGIRSTVDGN